MAENVGIAEYKNDKIWHYRPLKSVYYLGCPEYPNLVGCFYASLCRYQLPNVACTELAEVLPLVNPFKNREIEFGFSLQNIKTVFETVGLMNIRATI